ncbi:MAG TPA: twin-arginine translocase subunit TatC [Trichormus sp.]|jgi:sec-independent protein translocase protein TatC
MTPEPPQAEPLVKIGPATGATSPVAQQGSETLAEPEASKQSLAPAEVPADQPPALIADGGDAPPNGGQPMSEPESAPEPTASPVSEPVSEPASSRSVVNVPLPPASSSGPDEPAERTPETAVMTVVEHLDELRHRLIRSILYLFCSFVLALFWTKSILLWLEKPAGGIEFQTLSIEEPILVYIKVAFYAALALASPMVLIEIGQFIAPGLTKRERSLLGPIVIGSPLLFFGGVCFAYICLLPPMMHFFQSFGAGVAPIHQRLDFYISLVSSILLYIGLSFQLPIIIFCLSFTGLINSGHLVRLWKYALILIAMVAAVVTPDPTAMSMIMVMLALMTLYFLSYIMLRVKETFWSKSA